MLIVLLMLIFSHVSLLQTRILDTSRLNSLALGVLSNNSLQIDGQND